MSYEHAVYVATLVAAMPPLTPEQRDRLAVLLRPPARESAAPPLGGENAA